MIGVDWGTTSCRAYRLDTAGRILDRRESEYGAARVKPGGFAEVLESQVGDWVRAGEGPVVLSGMVGSRIGWREVPYRPCPVSLDQLGSSLTPIHWPLGDAWIVPGVSWIGPDQAPDVMRGEETQVVGVFDLLPSRALVCLPGTHSKWCVVEDRRLVRFSTYLTGELFRLLRDHSTLGVGPEVESPGAGWFDEGLARASASGGLGHHLFGVRARSVTGDLPAQGAAEYLSGLLIGHEIAHLAWDDACVHLIGSTALTARYRRALERAGRDVRVLDPDAAARGLFLLARDLKVNARIP